MRHRMARCVPAVTVGFLVLAGTAPAAWAAGSTVSPKATTPLLQQKSPADVKRESVVPGQRAAKPDLVPVSCRAADWVTVRIKNEGNAPANFPAGVAPFDAVIQSPAFPGGSAHALWETGSLPGANLAPGETKEFGTPRFHWLPPGTHIVRVTVDPHNRIDESNKSNNHVICSVTVPNRPLPDVVISKIVLDPPNPTSQSSFVLKITVKNQGDADYFFRTRDGGRFLCARILGGVGGGCYDGGASLLPNQSGVFDLRVTAGSSMVGTHPWTVTVDPSNIVVERDKSNNTATINITVTQ